MLYTLHTILEQQTGPVSFQPCRSVTGTGGVDCNLQPSLGGGGVGAASGPAPVVVDAKGIARVGGIRIGSASTYRFRFALGPLNLTTASFIVAAGRPAGLVVRPTGGAGAFPQALVANVSMGPVRLEAKDEAGNLVPLGALALGVTVAVERYGLAYDVPNRTCGNDGAVLASSPGVGGDLRANLTCGPSADACVLTGVLITAPGRYRLGVTARAIRNSSACFIPVQRLNCTSVTNASAVNGSLARAVNGSLANASASNVQNCTIYTVAWAQVTSPTLHLRS